MPLTLIPTERAIQEAAHWDAQAEYDIGVLIACYLERHPPPYDSSTAALLVACSRDLQESGEKRLDRMGERRLRALGGDV
jgi:hypothetical protein